MRFSNQIDPRATSPGLMLRSENVAMREAPKFGAAHVNPERNVTLNATDERRRTCLRKRCLGLASSLASLPGESSQLNTSGRYFAPRRASMPCVLFSSCTVSALLGSHSW
jgi:hypothetical protein